MIPENVKELEFKIAAANQKRLRRDWAASSDQRMCRFQQLQATVLETLACNPQALDAFQRRNHQRRRQACVKQLETEMRRVSQPEAENHSQDA